MIATISNFVAKTIGLENLDDETLFNYMSSFVQKSVRASIGEATMDIGDFLLMQYNEVVPIKVRRSEYASITNLKSILGYTDGVIEGQVIEDKSIKTTSDALRLAKAQLDKYSDMVITATFNTYKVGLKAGQTIRIKDTDNGTRNIDQDFVIQKVVSHEKEQGYLEYKITCSSLLFGMLELLIQLLRQTRKISVQEDATIANVEDAYETISITDSWDSAVDDNLVQEIISVSDSVISVVFTPPFKYEPTGLSVSRYNLASYS